MIDDGILLQQDGSLLAGWSYRGPDMMSAAAAEMDALSARLNHVLRLGSGWMVQCDAIRSRAPGYPEHGAFPDPVTRVIDDERRQQFMEEGAHFESEYFLTLTYLPPPEVEERAKGWLFEGRGAYSSEKDGGPASRSLSRQGGHVRERFRPALSNGASASGSPSPTIAVDEHVHDRLLRYLRRCISGLDHPFALPEIPCYLNEILACEDFYGGMEPRIGRKHIRVSRSTGSRG